MPAADDAGPEEGESQLEMILQHQRTASGVLLVCAAAVAPPRAVAEINLQWRVSAQVVRVGQTVEVGLYAISDDDSDQPFGGIDAILSWDPGVIELVDKIDDGPYAWLTSSFPNDENIESLNADCGAIVFCDPYSGMPFNDGDALYQSVMQFPPNPPPYATPHGLLVTTMRFNAPTATPATEIALLEAVGEQSTIVVDTEDLGADVTGTLESVTLSIAACGSWGDFDGDCGVDLVDFKEFEACLTGPGDTSRGSGCQAADFDDDGDADLRDIGRLQLAFTGP
ncbi:MAG: hypothetical protein JSU86_04625 [Phycisphaerales bacterium]|nr:MAG: hypothetical protein JSU86_04625 [Phycisphaerales bacterium]